MNLLELRDEYLRSLDNTYPEEWYSTNQEFARVEIDNFFEWLRIYSKSRSGRSGNGLQILSAEFDSPATFQA